MNVDFFDQISFLMRMEGEKMEQAINQVESELNRLAQEIEHQRVLGNQNKIDELQEDREEWLIIMTALMNQGK